MAVAEVSTAADGQTKAEGPRQMEAVDRNNLWLAYGHVMRNKGAAGVDRLALPEFKAWLQQHWPSVKAALLAGSYLPRPVRKAEIPKPSGGGRTLGIPTVLDRLIQQALLQVLQPEFESGFSEHSYDLECKLKLRVSREKSAVARPWHWKFLGYSVTWHRQVRLKIADSSLNRLKDRACPT